MDAGTVGVFVPIAAIVAWGAIKVATINAQHRSGGDPEAAGRLQALEGEVGTLRQELTEVHERLDFAERLLAQHPPDRLDAAK